MSSTQIVFPQFNINGSSPEWMADSYRQAWGRINAAEAALIETTPHERDYQTDQTRELYRRAMDQHLHRLAMLREVKTDLEQLWAAAYEQHEKTRGLEHGTEANRT